MNQPDDLDDFADLFEDVKSLSDHQLQLTIGAIRSPAVPWRSVHPVVAQFPRLADDAYATLFDDIKANGQRKAVCMYQGMIWDGRARYDACMDLGLVPKVAVLRRGDPIIFLLHRHRDKFGLPRSPERNAALAILNRIETLEWKKEAQDRREGWIAAARTEFQVQRRYAKPCAVCGLSDEYSHAHHSLPLNLQYALGVDMPIQEHDWLCPVHHKLIHQRISAEILGSRRPEGYDYHHRYKTEGDRTKAAGAIYDLTEKVRRLFTEVGGISPRGNWSMLTP